LKKKKLAKKYWTNLHVLESVKALSKTPADALVEAGIPKLLVHSLLQMANEEGKHIVGSKVAEFNYFAFDLSLFICSLWMLSKLIEWYPMFFCDSLLICINTVCVPVLFILYGFTFRCIRQ